MQENIPVVVPRRLKEHFEIAWAHCRVFLFSAPCGCGKTTVAKRLLQKAVVCERSAEEPDCFTEKIPERCTVLLLDDLQSLKDAAQQQVLCEWIRSMPHIRFVLLSRGKAPGWLMPFQFAGIMEIFEMESLLFDRPSVEALLSAYGVTGLDETAITTIWRESIGHPAGLAVFARHLTAGKTLDATMLGTIRHEIYAYFDEMVYRRLDSNLRRFLLELASFEHFGVEFARMVSGESLAGEYLEVLRQDTSMLIADAPDSFHFQPFFQEFIRWELEREFTTQEKKNLYSRAALYYELAGALRLALDCYAKAEEYSKMCGLLVKNAALHPGIAQYYELEKYYFSLPKEEVLRSPELMAGMSMLCALCMEYEQSEQWYGALQDYAAKLKKSDAEYKRACGRVAFLDIALPHRGIDGLLEIIPRVFRLLTAKSIERPCVSVTAMLPSVMNGGKDFSEWSKKDDLLYATLKIPLEAVLGRDGVGLADCAICESKFEKDDNYMPRLLTLMSRLGEIQRHGTPDIEFAAIGLLARTQIIQGKASSALNAILELKQKFSESGNTRFFANIEAMLCRIHLYLGNLDEAALWLRDQRTKASQRLWPMHRYRYRTTAMAEIALGNYESALLVGRMLPYTEQCDRILERLHIHLLMAICHYRMGDPAWREELNGALDTASEYSFVTPIAEYGAAVLPLLVASGRAKGSDFGKRVLDSTRKQAVHYPDFLQPNSKLIAPLTAAETQVMRLLCHNKSNQEICEILGVQLPTVKTHVRNVLDKLGISRRIEVKAVAEQLHLI